MFVLLVQDSVGAVETGTLVSVEAMVGYYPCIMTTLTRTTDRGGRQCQVGSLTGAVAYSQKVTEAPKGSLRMVGNHSQSVKGTSELDCETDRSSRDESRA